MITYKLVFNCTKIFITKKTKLILDRFFSGLNVFEISGNWTDKSHFFTPPTGVLTSGLLYWCYDVCVSWEPNLQVTSRLLLLDMDLVPFWANQEVIIISHFKWKYVAHNGDLYVTFRKYLKTLPWHQNNINWSTSRVCKTHQSIIKIFVHRQQSTAQVSPPSRVTLIGSLAFWMPLTKSKVTSGAETKSYSEKKAGWTVATICAPWHANPRFTQLMISGMYTQFLSMWKNNSADDWYLIETTTHEHKT